MRGIYVSSRVVSASVVGVTCACGVDWIVVDAVDQSDNSDEMAGGSCSTAPPLSQTSQERTSCWMRNGCRCQCKGNFIRRDKPGKVMFLFCFPTQTITR